MLTKNAVFFWFSIFSLFTFSELVRGQISDSKTEKSQAVTSAPESSRLKELKEVLVEFGVEPNIKSINNYLRSLIPDQQTVVETRKWVERLQDSSFAKRKEASKQLINMPVITMELIQEMLDHADLEVAFRAREIFNARSRHVKRIRLAIFEFLTESKAGSVTPILLSVYSQFTDEQVIRAANQVIKVTSERVDLPLLLKHANQFEENQQLAMGCLSAINRLDRDQSFQWISRQQTHLKNDLFKLYCADILAKNKRRECLDFYVELLSAPLDRCRYRAFSVLKRMTGQTFGYAVGKGSDQLAAIARWDDYISKNGGSIKIEHQFGRIRLGRLLVCSYSTGLVSSYDENGKLKWTVTGKNPFTCQGLPNGNCLVMFYTTGKLVEYDENGKVVKEFTGLPASTSGLQRLENGHTLLSSGQAGNKILEIDQEGEQVWSTTLTGTPTSARLQENGLILATLYASSKLVEIDRKGKVQKEIAVKGKPYTAQRLENGNLMVAFSKGGVAEYTDDGKEVWRVETGSNTYWADLLEDGTIITADKTGILQVTREGKVISRNAKHTNITYISSY